MKKRIPKEKIKLLWKKQYPHTKQPPIKAYLVSGNVINKLTDDSFKGKRGLKQNTKKEYGKQNTITSKTHRVSGLIIKEGRTNIVWIRKGTKRMETRVTNHELKHIHNKET